MNEQPTQDQVNGHANEEGMGARLSPSEKAYLDAANKLITASRLEVFRNLQAMTGDDPPPPPLVDLLSYLMASLRMREADNYALVSLLKDLKLATVDEFKDRAAAHGEKYAMQLYAAAKKAMEQPAIFVPRGHNG